jgi:hypothetical protein
VWPHSRIVDIKRFVRLIVATQGLITHLTPRDLRDDVAAVTVQLDTLAGHYHDGGYALAQLLRLADSGPDRDNTTVAVIDLLDHHREGQ